MGAEARWAILCAVTSALMGCAVGADLNDELVDSDDDVISTAADPEIFALTGAKYGTVSWTGGANLTVRSGPGASHGSIGSIREGTRVRIGCQTTGTSVGGNTVWDYLPDHRGYVADYYMNTGYSSWITDLARCGTEPTTGACADLDYHGLCDGERLIWCEGGTRRSVDCASDGRACVWESDAVGFDCVAGSGSGGTAPSGTRLTISRILGNRSHYTTQPFGHTAFAASHASWYAYCYEYGPWTRPIHCAMDVGVPRGTPVYASDDATIVRAGSDYYEDAYTHAGELRFQLADGTHVIYGHLSRFAVSNGQRVRRGDVIGYTGTMNGDHLHLEVRVPDRSTRSGYRAVDPSTFFGP
ncbi:MAG: peptidoglycan DD-metalloendopeptidase family protein [Myxococcota bacterium]|nr:peptidoglycan DD-metalloendopeptidase family protein [Myxococcota bacterium]